MTRNLADDGSNPDLSSLADAVAFVVRSGGLLKEILWSSVKPSIASYALITNSASLFSPLDATTYFWGTPPFANPKTSSTLRKQFIPKTGKITRVDITVHNNSGTVGSNETSTINIRLNDTTDFPLTTVLTADAASGESRYFNITGLSIPVTAGDFIEIKWVTPTWATNPTNVLIYMQIFVECG